MKQVILKNNTDQELEFMSLGGIVLEASSTRDISELAFDLIVNSDDLQEAVASGTVTVNNGNIDLPASRALTYLSYEDAAYIQGVPVVQPEFATLSGGFTMRYQADQQNWVYDTFRLTELEDVYVDEETGQYTVLSPTGSGVIVPVVPPDEFTELLDTPTTYSGQGGDFVKVKADETGLEFLSKEEMGCKVLPQTYHACDCDLTGTTSTNWINKVTLTIPPTASGTYKVEWYCEMNVTSTYKSAMMRVRVDDAPGYLGEVMYEPKDTTNWMPNGGFAILYLSGGNNIKLDIKTESTSTTVKSKNARLAATEVNTDHHCHCILTNVTDTNTGGPGHCDDDDDCDADYGFTGTPDDGEDDD